MQDDAPLPWRQVLNKHHLATAEELAASLDWEVREARTQALAAERIAAAGELEKVRAATRTEARQAAFTEASEAFNQLLRRIRQAPSEAAAWHLMTEASAPWCDRMVVLSIETNQAECVAHRGLAASDPAGAFDMAAAPAIASASDSRDPMVALASAGELSHGLAAALGDDADQKAYLFPVVSRQISVAMAIAVGNVSPAPLEFLSEAIGLRVEVLRLEVLRLASSADEEQAAEAEPAPVVTPQTELLQIAGAPPVTEASAGSWHDLSADDQKLHLQAQRIARVRVAEMRLYRPEELRKGVFAGDIYGSLQADIDRARAEFLQSFLSKSDTMVDYLHLEIMRSLAHDDHRLLGPEYPGPMV